MNQQCDVKVTVSRSNGDSDAGSISGLDYLFFIFLKQVYY